MSVKLLSESVAELETYGEIRPAKRLEVGAERLRDASAALLDAATIISRVPHDQRGDLPGKIRKLLDGMEGIHLDGSRALAEETEALRDIAYHEERRNLKAIQ